MEYNTRDIFFGKPTYNTGIEGHYETGVEPFLKQGDKYLTIRTVKAGKRLLLGEFTPNTDEYLTVSELTPIVEQMGVKEIPEKISDKMINLYLLRYKVKSLFKKNCVSGYQKTK